jgi:hypothetical protein
MGKSDTFSLGKKIREVEKDLTKELVKWKIKRDGLPKPDEEILERGTEQIVDEAHRVVKKGGKRILEELKSVKKEFLKAYHSEDEKEGE